VAAWAAGIVLVGPLGYALVQLLEPKAPRPRPVAPARMSVLSVAASCDLA
jgi:hypothetical protein